MRRAPQIPQATMPRLRTPIGRTAALSVFVHAALLVALLWNPDGPETEGGDPGRPGGGGGGGGPRITYVALGAYSAAALLAEVPAAVTIPRIRSPRTIREIPVSARTPTVRRESTPPPLARAIGAGAGMRGGAGAGAGTGGGVGSGQGTGQGSGVGPGAGGTAGDVLPPTVRFTALPPFEDRPASVRGRSFQVYFTVGRDGRVLDVSVEPRMEDARYRKKFLDAMRRYRFNPASLRDGTTVQGRAVVSVTL